MFIRKTIIPIKNIECGGGNFQPRSESSDQETTSNLRSARTGKLSSILIFIILGWFSIQKYVKYI